ncbi:MAG TPA: inositol monophosphatase family protein [Arthrobacter sp.]|nr:inositol monophosphatase family protein [Arthrobacter sp.]
MTSKLERASAAAIDLALTYLEGPPSTELTYKTERDYATSTDYAVEDALRQLLVDLTPAIGFLGEERGHTGDRETYWCLDPIDGTTNYSRGVPNFGVSLALIDAGTPVNGEIALPAHRERYVTRGGDAYLGHSQIRVAGTANLDEALVSMGDFATGEGSLEENHRRVTTIARLANRVGRVRMLGSVATDLAWLAAGRVDAVIVHSNKPWDMASGVALARAAGAVVTHHDGTPYSIEGPDLLAAAPSIHAALIDAIAS